MVAVVLLSVLGLYFDAPSMATLLQSSTPIASTAPMSSTATATPISLPNVTRIPLSFDPAKRTVVLFFDDSRESQYVYALPILREYGWHATFSVVVGALGWPGFFTAVQVQTLSAEGMEIASHTVSHLNLTALAQTNETTLKYELVDSKTYLQNLTGAPVNTLIVPFDTPITPTLQQAMISAGYTSIRPIDGTYWAYGQDEAKVESWLSAPNSIPGYAVYRGANDTVLLAYHQITNSTTVNCDRTESLTCVTSPKQFTDEMVWMHAHNFNVISWRDCLALKLCKFAWPNPTHAAPALQLPSRVPEEPSITILAWSSTNAPSVNFDAIPIRDFVGLWT